MWLAMSRFLYGALKCLFFSNLLFFAARTANAESCLPGVGCFSEDAKVSVPKMTIIFSKDADLTFDTLSLADGTIFEIGGLHLKLKVRNLDIGGRAVVRTFAPTVVANKPPTPPPVGQGASYDPGPATGGNCAACVGRPGGNGTEGRPGATGVAGQTGGYVAIQILNSMSGELLVDARGQYGGLGGDGGDGGPGGTGEQGGRAQSGLLDCSTGPGYGGRGGAGGDGGKGGDGGNGGDGGIVVLQVPQTVRQAISVMVDGGPGGEGGAPGRGGSGGAGGAGGRGDRLCQGRETERKGERGVDGRPSPSSDIMSLKGAKGSKGRPGTLIELKS